MVVTPKPHPGIWLVVGFRSDGQPAANGEAHVNRPRAVARLAEIRADYAKYPDSEPLDFRIVHYCAPTVDCTSGDE